ncbi:uncharacterized protein KRP23_14915 [Phytophthora ramorum]|nr:hypothetical protein KRP23_14915 [Phytophthora ramorum]
MMTTAGVTKAESRPLVDARSLRGYKLSEAEDDERTINVSASIDDVIKRLNAGKIALDYVVNLKKLDKKVLRAFKRLPTKENSYLNKVFVQPKLDKMLKDEKYAQKSFLEWYALGFSGETIKSRLGGVGAHFDTLFTQYTVFVSRIKK